MTAPDAPDGLNEPPLVEGESISGLVTDFDGEPMVGVRVEAAETGGGDLDLLPVLSDGGGAFELTGLVPGSRYDLRFELGTVKARTLSVPVGTAQLQVKLARPQGIQLAVKTEPGQAPPDVIHVVLHRLGPKGAIREYFGRTLRQRLLLWSIRPGRYTVTVWGGPYLPVVANDVFVNPREAAPEVEILLSAKGGTVGGEVEDASGDGCSGFVSWRRLDAEGHAPPHLTTIATDSKGNFVYRGLPEGRYRFSAYAESGGLGEAEIDVHEERSTSVTIGLRQA